jgi:hypothetical protein
MAEKRDTNDVLLAGGPAAVRALFRNAKPYTDLSFDGRILQLALLNDREYDAARQKLWEDNKKSGIRMPTIDDLVKKARARLDLEATAAAAAKGAGAADDASAWVGPVSLPEALEQVASVIDDHVLLPAPYRHLVALFVFFAHLCFRNRGHIRTCFLLKLQSKSPGSGKTELCLTLGKLLPGSNVQTRQGYTAATLRQDILAAMEDDQPTPIVILDEADQLLLGSMVPYLNATTTRGTRVDWNVQLPSGCR